MTRLRRPETSGIHECGRSLSAESLVFAGESSGHPADVFFGNLLGFFQHGINSELGTNQAAQPTVNAILGLEHELGRMVAFFIKSVTELQASIGTELYAKSATFAATLYDTHFSLRDGMRFSIKGQSPELHVGPLRSVECKTVIV
jgi:hypothetical protein